MSDWLALPNNKWLNMSQVRAVRQLPKDEQLRTGYMGIAEFNGGGTEFDEAVMRLKPDSWRAVVAWLDDHERPAAH